MFQYSDFRLQCQARPPLDYCLKQSYGVDSLGAASAHDEGHVTLCHEVGRILLYGEWRAAP